MMNHWLTKTVHVLPVPVNQETDYVQKQVICRHTHDTYESVHTRKRVILSCKTDEFRLLHCTLYHLPWYDTMCLGHVQ